MGSSPEIAQESEAVFLQICQQLSVLNSRLVFFFLFKGREKPTVFLHFAECRYLFCMVLCIVLGSMTEGPFLLFFFHQSLPSSKDDDCIVNNT